MRKLPAILLIVAALTGISSAQAAPIVVGVSYSNFQEERWKTDEAAIRQVVDAAGDKYISTDAQSSADKQITDIDALIAQGANVLLVVAQDTESIRPAVQKALDAGIPVIAYDRLIENPKAFYITFDNEGIGKLMAQILYKQVPKGNYVFIKGNAADPNADFLYAGMQQVLAGPLQSGDIKNVGETYTDNWDPSNAQREMEQFLDRTGNKVDAVLSENDGMAGGVVAALAAQGLAGQVAVSGQDADHAALNRVALGTQTVSVWKDARALGAAAAKVAIQLAGGTPVDKIQGAVVFADGPHKVPMQSIFLTADPITRDNLKDVIDAGWITESDLCQGVPPGNVAVCG